MIINKEITVDLSDKYPSKLMFNSNELNTESLFLKIKIYNNKKPVTVSSNDKVEATIVINNTLAVSNRICSRDSDNAISVNISNVKDEITTIRPGLMLVEIKITSNNGEVYVLPVIGVLVSSSIANSSNITDKSYGTVADFVREVMDARGEYDSLDKRLEAMIVGNIENGSITAEKLAADLLAKIDGTEVGLSMLYTTVDGLKADVNGKMDDKDGVVKTQNLAQNLKEVYDAVRGVMTVGNKLMIGTAHLEDDSVDASKIQMAAVDFSKLDPNMVDDVGDATNAWTQANDRHIPTTKLVKGWLEEDKEDIQNLQNGKLDNAPKFCIV